MSSADRKFVKERMDLSTEQGRRLAGRFGWCRPKDHDLELKLKSELSAMLKAAEALGRKADDEKLQQSLLTAIRAVHAAALTRLGLVCACHLNVLYELIASRAAAWLFAVPALIRSREAQDQRLADVLTAGLKRPVVVELHGRGQPQVGHQSRVCASRSPCAPVYIA